MINTTGDTSSTIDSFNVASYTTNTITVVEDIEDYSFTDTCGQLYIPVPNPTENAEVLIEVTSSSDRVKEVLPVGEFMVDSFEQCQDYIGNVDTYIGVENAIVKPSATNKDNLYKEVPDTFTLEEIPDITTAISGDMITCSIENMTFKGLYSKVYSQS